MFQSPSNLSPLVHHLDRASASTEIRRLVYRQAGCRRRTTGIWGTRTSWVSETHGFGRYLLSASVSCSGRELYSRRTGLQRVGSVLDQRYAGLILSASRRKLNRHVRIDPARIIRLPSGSPSRFSRSRRQRSLVETRQRAFKLSQSTVQDFYFAS